VSGNDIPHDPEKSPSIVVVAKDRLPSDAARGDVIGGTGYLEPRMTGHGRQA
jgi:hypothetical protein